MILPIKKKWFDMIRSGEKKEEYREIKPYYDSRFRSRIKLPITVMSIEEIKRDFESEAKRC